MLTGRLLLMLVVMTATLATRQPAAVLASSAESLALPVERTTWVQRLGAGVTRSFSRIGLMQRVTLRVTPVQLGLPVGGDVTPPFMGTPDPLRSCLPPPVV